MTKRRSGTVNRGWIVGAATAVLLISAASGGLYLNSNDDDRQTTSTTPYAPPLPTVPPSIPPLSENPTIAFYGDSLTAGSFAPTDAETFRGIITQTTSATSLVTAQAGIRTGSFANQNAIAGADLTIVELGTHDVDNTSIEDFSGSYSALLKNVRTANPDGGIICLGTWTNEFQARPYDTVIRTACTESGGVTITLYPIYADQKNRGPEGVKVGTVVADNFYPNIFGHALIARMILRNMTNQTVPEP